MINVLIAIHILCTIAIIGLVLIQHGKGADAGAAFGGGGGGGASGSLFGSQGSANFLSRTTAVIATIFFLTSLSLTYLYSHTAKPKSVTETVLEAPADTPAVVEEQQEVPALPEVPVDEVAPQTVEDVPAAPANTGSETTDTGVPAAPSDQTPAN
jgi:preprotein translocase subunit SecG